MCKHVTILMSCRLKIKCMGRTINDDAYGRVLVCRWGGASCHHQQMRRKMTWEFRACPQFSIIYFIKHLGKQSKMKPKRQLLDNLISQNYYFRITEFSFPIFYLLFSSWKIEQKSVASTLIMLEIGNKLR